MGLIRNFWSAWKKLAHKIGVFQSKVILTVFYFLFLTPFGFIYSFFKDELKIRKTKNSFWHAKKNQSESIADLKQQS